MNNRKNMLFSALIFLLLGAVLVFATVRTVHMNRWKYGHVNTDNLDGKMIGINIVEPQDVNRLELMPDIVSWFENWYSDSGIVKLELCGRNRAAVPLITWQPVDVPFEEIVNGDHDEYLRDFFRRVADSCPDLPVLIRFAHEMEMSPNYGKPWYQWQGIDSELYIRAWRHIVSMSDEICPQIRWIWSPNIMSEYARPYYPGENYVDYVGITVNLPASTSLKYNDFGEFFLQSCKGNALGEFKKPVIISETGFHSNKEDHEDSINFILSVFKYIRHDPNLKAVVFLDTDDEREGRQYRFTDNEACVKVFCEEIRKLREDQLLLEGDSNEEE